MHTHHTHTCTYTHTHKHTRTNMHTHTHIQSHNHNHTHTHNHTQSHMHTRPCTRRTLDYQGVLDALAQKGISIRVASPKLVMEEVSVMCSIQVDKPCSNSFTGTGDRSLVRVIRGTDHYRSLVRRTDHWYGGQITGTGDCVLWKSLNKLQYSYLGSRSKGIAWGRSLFMSPTIKIW